MLSKMLLKIACFLEYRFRRVLGRVLGGFWKAKNLDFRFFFDGFSMPFLKRLILNFNMSTKGQQERGDNFSEGGRWDGGRPLAKPREESGRSLCLSHTPSVRLRRMRRIFRLPPCHRPSGGDDGLAKVFEIFAKFLDNAGAKKNFRS